MGIRDLQERPLAVVWDAMKKAIEDAEAGLWRPYFDRFQVRGSHLDRDIAAVNQIYEEVHGLAADAALGRRYRAQQAVRRID